MAMEGRGVLYVGHLPNGFEELQLRDYFNQFGTVTRLRLSRSIKTGRPRGYAFVEFSSDEVAAIAAESMNGYLMFNKVLKCKVLPADKIHPSMFRGCFKRFKPSSAWKRAVNARNKDKDQTKSVEATNRARRRISKRLGKLRNLGLNPPRPDGTQVTTPSDSAATKNITSDVEKSDEKSLKDKKILAQQRKSSKHSFLKKRS